MNQDSQFQSLIHFYDTHPINEKQIIQKLQKQGLALEEITAEHLQKLLNYLAKPIIENGLTRTAFLWRYLRPINWVGLVLSPNAIMMQIDSRG